MARIPVVIPCFHESKNVLKLLKRLPPDKVEVIIVVNGADDDDYSQAAGYSKIIRVPQQGKMVAIQAALTYLKERALNPIIILDADTAPLSPRHWAEHLTDILNASRMPIVVGGPVIFIKGGIVENIIRSVRRIRRAIRSRTNFNRRIGQLGPCMGIKIMNRTLLKDIMELPNIWPGEDQAIMQLFVNNGGSFQQSLDPLLLCTTLTPEAYASFSRRLKVGAAMAQREKEDYYSKHSPADSVTYKEYIRGSRSKNK